MTAPVSPKKQRSRQRFHPFVIVLFLCVILAFLPEPELSVGLHHHRFDVATIQVRKDRDYNDSVANAGNATLSHDTSPVREQTFVVMPGPHKTGTTSVQAALFRWMNRQINAPAFANWSYPVPTREDFESIQSTNGKIVGGKGFAPMVTRLYANPGLSPEESIRSPMLQLYRQTISRAWDAGKSIVIASENLDRLAKEIQGDDDGPHVTPERLWERFLQLLPRLSSSNMIIGIQYRTPRIDQLISMWHQLGKRGESLVDFITNPIRPGLASVAHSLNPLGLADFFVQRGYTIRIIDTGRVVQAGKMTLPTAVACYILQVPVCADDDGARSPLSGGNSTERWFNQRSDNGDRVLNTEILQAIDQLLVNFDCQYLEAWNGSNVEWFVGELGGHQMAGFAADCSSKNVTVRRPFSETIQAIVKLVCDAHPDAKNCVSTRIRRSGAS